MQTHNERIAELVKKIVAKESHLSYSALTNFMDSPKSFIDYKFKTFEETDAMRFGTMVHCLVLEPESFESRYFVIDDAEIIAEIGGAKPRATKAYKEWKDAQVSDSGGRVIVESGDFKSAEIMAMGIRSNRAAKRVMEKAPQREVKVEWEYMNFAFRGIIDGMGDVLFDLKTCQSAEPRKFQRDIISMGYHIQAALYLQSIGESKPYYIIAADKSGGISVHQLHEHLIDHARQECERLTAHFNALCLEALEGNPGAWNQSYEYWAERFDGIYNADKPAYLY